MIYRGGSRLLSLMVQSYYSLNSYMERRKQILRRKKDGRSLRLRQRMVEEAALRPRSKREEPRDTKPGFSSTQWGKLITQLKSRNDGAGPCISSREGKLFRRRFRVPLPVYCSLVSKCVDDKLFGPNSNDEKDCCGNEMCPPSIKLLGVLRMLGRNWICDDVAEATGMGESTVRLAFNATLTLTLARTPILTLTLTRTQR
jgi:hypothetical protein